MIFESHAHYEDERFKEDQKELLESFPSNGIGYVVNVSSSIDTIKKTRELPSQYQFIYGAVGIHPEMAEEITDESLSFIKESAIKSKIVSIGEIGLDYYWDEPGRPIQKKAFEQQIDLAKELSLPMIIHSRDAAKDTLDIMNSCKAEEAGGVIHCFSYSKEIAREFLNKGYYIGVGGVVTFKNGKKLREVVEYAPLESILLETDCPYMAPEPHRGTRNSSLNLTYIAKEIAKIKGIEYDKVIEVTEKNAKAMYCIE